MRSFFCILTPHFFTDCHHCSRVRNITLHYGGYYILGPYRIDLRIGLISKHSLLGVFFVPILRYSFLDNFWWLWLEQDKFQKLKWHGSSFLLLLLIKLYLRNLFNYTNYTNKEDSKQSRLSKVICSCPSYQNLGFVSLFWTLLAPFSRSDTYNTLINWSSCDWNQHLYSILTASIISSK